MPESKTHALQRYSSEKLCERIFERYAERISVKKPHVAVRNLVRIVEAFLKLSTRKGFHATSLRDLASASGMSMGGLYAYFDSKETLLVMILEQVEYAVVERLSEAPSDVIADPGRHLAWLIQAHIELTEWMQPWFMFAFMEAKSFPRPARHAAVESELVAEEHIARVLQAGVDQGVFQIDDVQMTASMIKPLLQDWYVKRSKYRRRGVSAESYARAVVALVLRAIKKHSGKHETTVADNSSVAP